MAKVRELELPIDEDTLEVSGQAQSLEVRVTYAIEIDIPLLADIGYQKIFEYAVAYGALAGRQSP